MKIDFSTIDRNVFAVLPGMIGGQLVYRVEPHYSGGSEKWTKENLCLRSSIWDSEGNLISAGLPKFFNLFIDEEGEIRTEHALVPKPASLKGYKIIDKIDGSLLVISKWKGNLIIRTRGTFDYSILSNSEEMEVLRATYPKVFAFFDNVETSTLSLLFEWYSPKNKIIINYGDEPKLWLIGGVYHNYYQLFHQSTLDMLGGTLEVSRPEVYDLGSLADAKACVEAMEGKEGVVMYPPDGQNPVKLKSPRYWSLCALKENVSSIDKVLDIYLSLQNPTFNSCYQFIHEKFDFELASYCRNWISCVADASKEVARILEGMEHFIESNNLRSKSDKQAYHEVYASYGSKTNRAGMLMNIRRGKEINVQGLKKLYLQVLKNKVK